MKFSNINDKTAKIALIEQSWIILTSVYIADTKHFWSYVTWLLLQGFNFSV